MTADPPSGWNAYAEQWGLLFESSGLPRSAGRIWGHLLTSDPAHQSLVQLCAELEISKGTASTSTRLLEGQGLLEQVAVRGSRASYYRIPADAFQELMRRKLDATVAWRELAEEGVDLAEGAPPVPTERLERLRDFYRFIEDRQRQILSEWTETRPLEPG